MTKIISFILCVFVAVVFFGHIIGEAVSTVRGHPQCIQYDVTGQCTDYER